MKKSIFAAVAMSALFAAGSAFAANPQGPGVLVLDGGGNAAFGNTFAVATPSFIDDYFFNVPALNAGDPVVNYQVGATIVKVGKTKLPESNADITGFTFFKVNADNSHTVLSADVADVYHFTDSSLSAGSYGFEITGHTLAVPGASGGSYSGNLNLTLTPVPEPETYGMLLVGLGLLGFTARRKSNPKLG